MCICIPRKHTIQNPPVVVVIVVAFFLLLKFYRFYQGILDGLKLFIDVFIPGGIALGRRYHNGFGIHHHKFWHAAAASSLDCWRFFQLDHNGRNRSYPYAKHKKDHQKNTAGNRKPFHTFLLSFLFVFYEWKEKETFACEYQKNGSYCIVWSLWSIQKLFPPFIYSVITRHHYLFSWLDYDYVPLLLPLYSLAELGVLLWSPYACHRCLCCWSCSWIGPFLFIVPCPIVSYLYSQVVFSQYPVSILRCVRMSKGRDDTDLFFIHIIIQASSSTQLWWEPSSPPLLCKGQVTDSTPFSGSTAPAPDYRRLMTHFYWTSSYYYWQSTGTGR